MDLSERRGGAARRHPWEVARARFFRGVVREARTFDRPLAVLDVGAGDGYLAASLFAELPPGSRLTCYDAHYADGDLRAYAAAAPPGISFTRTPPAERFDVLLLLDVMEHVPDDGAFLRGLTRDNLAEGGAVVISVPAWQPLFSRHDEALRHHRRYSPAQLRRVIAEEGLAIESQGGLFHSLLVPRLLTVAREAAQRRFGRLGKEPPLPPAVDEWKHGALVSKAVDALLALDNAASRAAGQIGLSLPGLSTWVVCRRAAATAPTPAAGSSP